MAEIRPALDPFIQAIITTLQTIQLGPTAMEVGDGVAPECDPPYLIVNVGPGGTYSGDMANPESDHIARVIVVAIGETAEMARLALDEARTVMVRETIDDNLANRRVMYAWLDVTRVDVREERGLPDPLFSAVDQYIVATTPTVNP